MKKIILFFIITTFSITQILAQQALVKGKVTDIYDEPLPGVNVTIKGLNKGTVTDIDGNFTIKVNDIKNDALKFSFLGFEKKIIPLNGNTTLNVVLKEEATNLEEVVIKSYGDIKKSDMTGSVSSVRVENQDIPNATVDQLLQGRAAGVTVTTTSAEPGAAINVRIRGLNSISISNQPLYVIDGIPMDVGIDTPNAMDSPDNKTYNPLVSLDPNDIASIEVLKDASATAIYGSRGANGVVLITTKGGSRKEVSEVTFGTSISLAHVSKTIPVLKPQQFAEFKNEYNFVSDVAAGDIPNIKYDGSDYPMPKDVEGYFWQDEILRNAWSQNYNLSMTGSAKKNYYYLSFNARLTNGIVLNSSLDRYSFNGKYNWDITEKLHYKIALSYAHASGKGTSTSGDVANITWSAMNWMLSKSPIVYDFGDDDYVDPAELETANPLTFVNEYVSEPVSNIFRGMFNLDYEVTKWLDLEMRYGLNYTHNRRGQYWPKTLPMVEDQGRAGYATSDQTSQTFNFLAHFDYNFNKANKINAVAGIELNSRNIESFKIKGDGFPDDALGYYNIEAASIVSPPVLTRVRSTLFSVIARVNYNYKNKYLLTATGRYDGSSRFSENQKFVFFPSFSAAWRVSQENFLKHSQTISNLKLRLSWGQAGNQGLPPYSTLARYYAVIYPLNGVSTSGYAIGDFPKDVTWETAQQLNGGVDFGMYNDRIYVSLDVYKKTTKNVLILRNMPTSSGYTTAWSNLGQIDNNGFDLETNFRIFDAKIRWDLGGNFSIYRNKISKLGLSESSYGYVQFWGKTINGFNQPINTFIEGNPIGQFWGFRTDGLFQTQEEIDELNQNAQDVAGENFYQFGKPVHPGDIKYVDLNHDGVVNDMDKTIIGDPNPDFTYGITSTLGYKNLSLNVFFVGVQGVDVFNANLLKMTNVGQGNSNVIEDAYLKAWRGEGTSDYWPRIVNDWQQNKLQPCDRLVEDGSFFRLQTASISYNAMVRKVSWISNLNVTFTATNVFTITNYSWYNPEANAFGNKNTAMGIDLNSYPMSRSYVLSFAISFK